MWVPKPPIVLGKDMADKLGVTVGDEVLVVRPQGELTPVGTCALTIDFTPVKPLGSQTSAVLNEVVKLTTNTLNVPKKLEKVDVTGKETSQ